MPNGHIGTHAHASTRKLADQQRAAWDVALLNSFAALEARLLNKVLPKGGSMGALIAVCHRDPLMHDNVRMLTCLRELHSVRLFLDSVPVQMNQPVIEQSVPAHQADFVAAQRSWVLSLLSPMFR